MSQISIPTPEVISIDDLKLNPHNVKEHPENQIVGLMELIKLEGFTIPLVIDKHNMIWAGHGRIEAARRLDMKKVPCVRLEHLTKKQLKAVMIMDNKINESAWNSDNLSQVLSEIPDFDFAKFHMDFDEFKIPEDADYKPDEQIEEDIRTDEKFRISFEFQQIAEYERVLQKLKSIDENKEIALLRLVESHED